MFDEAPDVHIDMKGTVELARMKGHKKSYRVHAFNPGTQKAEAEGSL